MNKILKENKDMSSILIEYLDIRAYFQGTDKSGKMNKDSQNKIYMELISDLRKEEKALAEKISEKVYEYGFLK